MKTFILSIILFSSLFISSFKNEIIGTWKVNLYIAYNDTIYKENFPEFTKQYFYKSLSSIQDSEAKEQKISKFSEELYNSINKVNLLVDKKTINSFKIGDFKNVIKINYAIENNKIILDKKQNEKYKYVLDYDSSKDKLTLRDEINFLKVEYIRLK